MHQAYLLATQLHLARVLTYVKVLQLHKDNFSPNHHRNLYLAQIYVHQWCSRYEANVATAPLKAFFHIVQTRYILDERKGRSWRAFLTFPAVLWLCSIQMSHIWVDGLLGLCAVLEYCAPLWHYALTKAQTEQLEALKKCHSHHFKLYQKYTVHDIHVCVICCKSQCSGQLQR